MNEFHAPVPWYIYPLRATIGPIFASFLSTCSLFSPNPVDPANAAGLLNWLYSDASTANSSGDPLTVASSRLAGTVVLDINGSSVSVTGRGDLSVTTPIFYGDEYSVSVDTQPTGQTCTITGGSGTFSADSSVTLNCTTFAEQAGYNGSTLSTSSACPNFEATGLPSLTVPLGADATVLVGLTSAVYHGSSNNGTKLILTNNGQEIARARGEKFWNGQNMAVGFTRVLSLSAGDHVFDTEFCVNGSGTGNIPGTVDHTLWAVVLESTPYYLGSRTATLSGASASNVTTPTDYGLGPLSITVNENAFLFASMHAGRFTRSENSRTELQLAINSTREASSTLNQGASNYIPTALYTGVDVTAGTHSVSSEWESTSATNTLTMDSAGDAPTVMNVVAFSQSAGAVKTNRIGPQLTWVPGGYLDMAEIGPINTNFTEDKRVLLTLQAHESWTDSNGNSANHAIAVDGVNQIVQRGFTENGGQMYSVNMSGIVTLSAGSRTIRHRMQAVGANSHNVGDARQTVMTMIPLD